jgi:hypothetical protein
MNFEHLTEEDKKFLYDVYNDTTLSYKNRLLKIQNYIGKSERTVKYWLVRLGYRRPLISKTSTKSNFTFNDVPFTKKRFIITWAQNKTPIFKEFWDNILAYSNFIDSEIIVIPGIYNGINENDYLWDDELINYIRYKELHIHKNVIVFSNISIIPTSVNPLTGLFDLTDKETCVFGSPKIFLDTIPSLTSDYKKYLMTTGAVTIPNYKKSKTGRRSEIKHKYGFVIAEIENDDICYIRQVTASSSDGSFNDIYFHVENSKITLNDKIPGIVLGDIHLYDTDEKIMDVTKTLLDDLHPEHVVIHDIFNGVSISHHDNNNIIKQYRKFLNGKLSLSEEINYMCDWVEKMQKYNLVIVKSNHDEFLDKWIINGEWKMNITNALEYVNYAKLLLDNDADNGIIPYILNQKFSNVKTLKRDESFKISGWEVGTHGDVGPNGKWGAFTLFNKLNLKIILGHYHSPRRSNDTVSVGTSTKLKLDYNIGASNWSNAHALIFDDESVEIIIFNNYNFTTLSPDKIK